jgi:CRP-like cAMP-binding protein
MDIPERVRHLGQLPPLRHLPGPALLELARVVVPRTFGAGTVLFDEGSAGREMFLIVDGEVRIERDTEASGPRRLAVLSRGDIFGELALIGRGPRSARAVADTDITLFALDRSSLEAWVRKEPVPAMSFFIELIRIESHSLRRVSNDLLVLHDLSHLVLERFEDETALLQAALMRLVAHLGSAWAGAAYRRDEFSGLTSLVARAGRPEMAMPDPLPDPDRAESRWLDGEGLCVPLIGRAGEPLGFLAVRTERSLSPRERADLSVSLTAAAQLLASAVQNVRHDVEERLRRRLDQAGSGFHF